MKPDVSPGTPGVIADGSRVRHSVQRVTGRIVGITTMPKYFEYPDDTFVYRLEIAPRKIIPCAPRNAEYIAPPEATPLTPTGLAGRDDGEPHNRLHSWQARGTHCFRCKSPIIRTTEAKCDVCRGTYCGNSQCRACLCSYAGPR